MTKVRENTKKGLIILFIYLVITFCLMMATTRIERLDKASSSDFRNDNASISLNFNK